MAGFMITKVVRVHEPIEMGPKGLSFGQLLDKMLEGMCAAGDEVQSVELEMAPEDWAAFRKANEPAEVAYDADWNSPAKTAKRKGGY